MSSQSVLQSTRMSSEFITLQLRDIKLWTVLSSCTLSSLIYSEVPLRQSHKLCNSDRSGAEVAIGRTSLHCQKSQKKKKKIPGKCEPTLETSCYQLQQQTKVHVLALAWQTNTLENCTKALEGCSTRNQTILLTITCTSSDCWVHMSLFYLDECCIHAMCAYPGYISANPTRCCFLPFAPLLAQAYPTMQHILLVIKSPSMDISTWSLYIHRVLSNVWMPPIIVQNQCQS